MRGISASVSIHSVAPKECSVGTFTAGSTSEFTEINNWKFDSIGP